MSKPSSARTCSGTGTNGDPRGAVVEGLVGPVVVVLDPHASTAACAAATSGNGPCAAKQSACRVWRKGSTLPVVVSDHGLVRMVSMPLRRQIRWSDEVPPAVSGFRTYA